MGVTLSGVRPERTNKHLELAAAEYLGGTHFQRSAGPALCSRSSQAMGVTISGMRSECTTKRLEIATAEHMGGNHFQESVCSAQLQFSGDVRDTLGHAP